LWSLDWVLVFAHALGSVGVVSSGLTAEASLCALVRLHRAL